VLNAPAADSSKQRQFSSPVGPPEPKLPAKHIPKKLVMPTLLQNSQPHSPVHHPKPAPDIKFAPDKVHDYAFDPVRSPLTTSRMEDSNGVPGKLVRKKTAEAEKTSRRRLSKKRNN
jgi:hypothetical protein